jgi:glycosidase
MLGVCQRHQAFYKIEGLMIMLNLKLSLHHIPDSRYCFPKDLHTIALRLRMEKMPKGTGEKAPQVTVLYGGKYDFYLKRQEAPLVKSFTDEVFDTYTIELHLEDTRLVYIFRIVMDGQEYFYSENGVTQTYDFERSYMSAFQYPFVNEVDIPKVPDWYRGAVTYEIFPERFAIGDTDKDVSYVTLKWGELPTPKSYAGGDLKGIVQKLGYIKELGINTLYLTPIFPSPTNHKYAITDYKEIDPQFGTKEDFQELVTKAHGMGIRVIMDAVFNHCHEDYPYFVDVKEKGKASPYHSWFFINGDKPDKKAKNYLTFADCDYMPRWNTGDPGARDFLLDIAVYWIKEYDIDGWRLDVSDEVSHDFWRRFRQAVKEAKEDCVIIGENWHDAYPFLQGDQYDGIMNYGFTRICMEYFTDRVTDETGLAEKLSGLLMRGTDIANAMMMNLLDSHDTHRFFTLLGEDEARFQGALALLYLFPGSPCIYYGTEIMMPGGYDPDCRRCMDWEAARKDSPLKQLLIRLSSLRKKDAVRKGTVRLDARDGFFLLERQYGEEKISLKLKDGFFEIVEQTAP